MASGTTKTTLSEEAIEAFRQGISKLVGREFTLDEKFSENTVNHANIEFRLPEEPSNIQGVRLRVGMSCSVHVIHNNRVAVIIELIANRSNIDELIRTDFESLLDPAWSRVFAKYMELLDGQEIVRDYMSRMREGETVEIWAGNSSGTLWTAKYKWEDGKVWKLLHGPSGHGWQAFPTLYEARRHIWSTHRAAESVRS